VKVLVAMIHSWIHCGRKAEAEPLPDGGGWVLRYSTRYLYMLTCLQLVLLTLATIAVAIIWTSDPEIGPIMSGATGALLVGCVYFAVDCRRLNVTFDDDGLTIHRMLVGPRGIEWSDIQSVVFNDWSLQIQPAVASRGSVPLAMDGLGTFAAYLDRHAPGTLADDVRQFLPAAP
jgi:hypothetical protein